VRELPDRILCLSCGKFFTPETYRDLEGICPDCRQNNFVEKRKAYWLKKKANGYKSQNATKKARKAYITKLTKLAVYDPKLYEIRMLSFYNREPKRATAARTQVRKNLKLIREKGMKIPVGKNSKYFSYKLSDLKK
jgi:predicted  nucleic acid-binding Zn-ribbon protein|tara:strand:+ start:6507 stop:6914 length:408 start_codon:yes stop_codon:yes gene_type:complete